MKQLGIRPLVTYYNRLGKDDSYHIIVGRLLQNITKIYDMTIREVAALCYTSEASISRLCRKAGYGGFNELRDQVGKTTKNYYMENRLIMPEFLRESNSVAVYLSSIRSMLDSLETALSDELLQKAVGLLRDASHVYYFGSSGEFFRLEQDLCVSGKYVDIWQNVNDLDIKMIEWTPDTLAIVDNPGYPWFQVDELVDRIKETGAKVLLITCSSNREIEKKADASIVVNGTKSGQDEFLYKTIIDILSVEYRKSCMDSWYYK